MTFAPQLYIREGVTDISFYTKAFGAIELRRWANDDGSIHVAELSVNGALFHLHVAAEEKHTPDPGQCNGTTVAIGLFVPDVDVVMQRAIEAGAVIVSPATDYEYGYRQGIVRDPFGHQWIVQKRI